MLLAALKNVTSHGRLQAMFKLWSNATSSTQATPTWGRANWKNAVTVLWTVPSGSQSQRGSNKIFHLLRVEWKEKVKCLPKRKKTQQEEKQAAVNGTHCMCVCVRVCVGIPCVNDFEMISSFSFQFEDWEFEYHSFLALLTRCWCDAGQYVNLIWAIG